MTLKDSIQKPWQKIVFYSGVLATLTGTFTLSGGVKWVQREIKSHAYMDALEKRVSELEKQQVIQKKADEFSFHFGRYMTDDPDKTIYWVDAGSGREEDLLEVDIRENNEGLQFAFVYGRWWPMRLSVDDADSTRLLLAWPDDKRRRLVPDR